LGDYIQHGSRFGVDGAGRIRLHGGTTKEPTCSSEALRTSAPHEQPEEHE
jgi:hypothetical protein